MFVSVKVVGRVRQLVHVRVEASRPGDSPMAEGAEGQERQSVQAGRQRR